MPFSLVIRSQRERGGKETAEQLFEQQVVTIGRGDSSDLVLKDPQRRVSSRHAEIRAKASSWVLVDIGSTNGTELNDVRITPRHEYLLKNGDRIGLGNFLLTFKGEISQQDRQSREAVVPAVGSEAPPLASVREGDSLLYVLRRTYADPEGFRGECRNDNLERLLRQRIAHLNRQEIESLLGDLCARLSTKASPVGIARPSRPAEPAEPASPSLSSAGEELASKDFLELVSQYCQESSQPLSREMLDQVYRRIGRVLQIVFTGLAGAIKGRREFQREFEVEATRILAWTPNPIKSAENAAEIGSLLLDPRSQGLTEDLVAVHLQEVFQDLTLHQLGLMAGFRECVRGLLKELDPAVLAKSEKGRPVGNRIGLLGGKSARAEAAAWGRFLEKYRQLTEEEVRVFERILAPHFAKGYLSIQKTHRRR